LPNLPSGVLFPRLQDNAVLEFLSYAAEEQRLGAQQRGDTFMNILPRSSGIYQILCVPTGKIYIGSAVDLRARWSKHCDGLRRGKHRNVYLKSAWDKYGAECFEFTVLELVDRSNLLITEQRWIDATRCTNREVGFNIYPIAGSPGAIHARIWEGFIDPDGNTVTITNLFDYCRHHDLNFTAMRSLATGKSKLKSYKGWTHRNSVRKREYVKTYVGFIAPDGSRPGPITNLTAFSRDHGLDNTHMVALAHGRLISHRGWTYDIGRQRLKRAYTGFVNPEGQSVIITNLAAFCREHGLHPVRMHNVKSGVRKSHKGWTWRETDERSAQQRRRAGIHQPPHPRDQSVPAPARS
jgi:group I intron endonuclease